MDIKQITDKFLSYIENEESKLLAWGYVDGGFTDEEFFKYTSAWVQSENLDIDPDDLIGNLKNLKLIAEYSTSKGKVIRTRMAESVRLFVKLRQIFKTENWRIAPNLVSDFRFKTQVRKYPARDINLEEIRKEVSLVAKKDELTYLELLLKRPNEMLLSRFQLEALVSMYESIQIPKSNGMIVCAGTGTGKTLSFYLPALSSISQWTKKNEYWVKSLALYPRNELLKDQFLETYQEARRLDEHLLATNKRKLIIGALFGDVPYNAQSLSYFPKWTKDKNGYICPFLVCPNSNCKSKMVWRNEDIKKSHERLCCEECNQTIEEDEIILTRKRMCESPPDILFTTTEMMNRLMSNIAFHKVLGIGVERSPRLMLLDEVHTYSGTHGAQVALLLRRWQHAIKNPIHFTGLSATLEDAPTFFSQLVGISKENVREIKVGENLISEGKEYQLILKGDASSGAPLLSTTIQAAMLSRRILDVYEGYPSEGLFGTKTFLFTDNLDSINRLYDTIREVEGYSKNRKTKDALANTRHYIEDQDYIQMLQQGQIWEMSESLGHNLRDGANVGRTSSQDTGVSSDAEVVIATASLEVGFNDPLVGSVIQHKSPMDMASFLQRKGRAGRRRGTRPWTIIILSDFGLDRLAYQNYENLMDPILTSRTLPLHNRYVLRMQAVYTFMDWASQELIEKHNFSFGDLWNGMAGPGTDFSKTLNENLANLIEEVLRSKQTRQRMEYYLQNALKISRSEVENLLWESPRPLLISVLPTLQRRLLTNWAKFEGAPQSKERFIKNHPLPEFIPANLFSDLTLPEIEIILPEEKTGNAGPNMPITQALKSYAPGKVNRRFGTNKMSQSHWIAPESFETSSEQILEIESFCTVYEELGKVKAREDKEDDIPLLRPWSLKLSNVPLKVGTTSNAFLRWGSELNATLKEQEELEVTIPKGTYWSRIIKDVYFYSHSRQSSIAIKRFATESSASIRYDRSQKSDITMKFTRNGQQVALGFQLEADGIRFKVMLPENIELGLDQEGTEKLFSFRTLYFQYKLSSDIDMCKKANKFQIDQISESYLSALTATALKKNYSLEEAFEELHKTASLQRILAKVFSSIYKTTIKENPKSVDHEDSDAFDDQDENNEDVRYQRIQEELLSLCSEEEVEQIIRKHASILWSELDEDAYDWALKRWLTTLGSAILQACAEITNQKSGAELILDIKFSENDSKEAEIWITEPTSGGGGIIEDIIEKYQADPRRFYRLVENSLGPSDLELVDVELLRILKLKKNDTHLQQIFEQIRTTNGIGNSSKNLKELQIYLRKRGILVIHPVMNSLYNRVLKPGSNNELDIFLEELIELWKNEEKRIGILMDVRVFAYVFSSNEDTVERFKKGLSHIDPTALDDTVWIFNIITSMLWSRGNIVRTKVLEPHNPYENFPPTDRDLIAQNISDYYEISLDNENWKEEVVACLNEKGNVCIVTKPEKHKNMQNVLLELTSEPIEVGFLHVYPRVEGLKRDAETLKAILDIREV